VRVNDQKTQKEGQEQPPWRRLILQLAVLAALIIFFLIYFIVPHWVIRTKRLTASPPYEVPPELQYRPPAPLPDAVNGYERLRQAAAMTPEKPQTSSFDLAWKFALERDWISQLEVDQFVEQLKPAWKLMDEALALPQWQCPLWTTHSAATLAQERNRHSFWPAFVLLTQGRAIQAKRLIAEGRLDEAVTELLNIIEVGRRVRTSGGALLEFINGVVAEGLGWSVLTQLRDTPKLRDETLKTIASRLPDPEELTESWQHALRAAFHLICRAELDAPSARSPWIFDPQETKRRIAEDFLVEMKNERAPFLARDRSVAQRLLQTHRAIHELRAELDRYEATGWLATWRLARTPNVYGKWLQYITAPVLSDSAEIMRRENLFWANAVPTIAALMVYRRQHGELPASLQPLLEANLLARLPRDPFDLKPLRYSREKQRLWSVGANGVDNGAATAESVLEGDIVAVIPEAEKTTSAAPAGDKPLTDTPK
jgi:hypothetical protein